uniref:Putative Glutamine dumper 2 n=1 Tax=Davidia involucrata TaxID=16924 RepID=A0A5B7APQ2_DAVIN
MRPTNTTSEVWEWNSPIPYLFGSLALVLGLITVALIVLACSYRKRASNSSTSSDDAEEKPVKSVKIMDTEADMGPKIAVIMAGDDNPTYLAKPVSSSTHCNTNGHI